MKREVVRGWIKRGLVRASREDHEKHRNVWKLEIDEAAAARLEQAASRSALRALRRKNLRRDPLPDRFEDGRYSVPGAARRFGVTENAVRGWIKCGSVSGEQKSHRNYPKVWWLDIDQSTADRLEVLAERSRTRSETIDW